MGKIKKMSLEKGQQAICIFDGTGWWTSSSGESIRGPKYKEIVTISGDDPDGGYFLKEYVSSEGYNKRFFIPLDDTFAEDVLKSVMEEIKAEEFELEEI